jgi:hypothetical protein
MVSWETEKNWHLGVGWLKEGAIKMPSPSLETRKQVLFPAAGSKIVWARAGR